MSTNYILNYTQETGFQLSKQTEGEENNYYALQIELQENPKEEHLSQLEDIMREIESDELRSLHLNLNSLYLKNDAKDGDVVEMNDEEYPAINTKSVQEFFKQLISHIPESCSAIYVEDLDEDNNQALLPILQNLPAHITGLSVKESELYSLDQSLLNDAFKSSKLERINLSGALIEYDEDMIANLGKSLPSSVEGIRLYTNYEDEDQADWLAELFDEDVIVWDEYEYQRSSLPDINFTDIAKNLWQGFSDWYHQKPEVLNPESNELESLEDSSKKEDTHFYVPLKPLDSPIKHPLFVEEELPKVTEVLPVETDPLTVTTNIESENDLVPVPVFEMPKDLEKDSVPTVKTPQVVESDSDLVPTEELLASNESSSSSPKELSESQHEEKPSSNICSSLLFGFFQALKHVSIILAAAVIGSLVGVGVGLGVSSLATPAVGLGVGIAAGVAAAGASSAMMYKFFSSSEKKEDDRKEYLLDSSTPVF